MRTLTLHEIGVDELPKENCCIVYFNSRTEHGMFEQNYTKAGKVSYLHGDFGEYNSLKEALDDGHSITIDENAFDEEGNVIHIALSIVETADVLLRGTLWMYEHEYYPVVGSISFPFQVESYYEQALAEGWCQRLRREEDSITRPNRFGEGTETMTFIDDTVVFNNKQFKVSWVCHSDGLRFQEFEEIKST